MKILSSLLILASLLLSCKQSNDDDSTIGAALADGRLKIELRGLRNIMTEESYGRSYIHTGSFVTIGDSLFTKRTLMILSMIKRISGGDSTQKRESNEFNVTTIINGVGEFKVYGGNHVKSQPWEPEKIEVRPIAVLPWENFKSISYSD